MTSIHFCRHCGGRFELDEQNHTRQRLTTELALGPRDLEAGSGKIFLGYRHLSLSARELRAIVDRRFPTNGISRAIRR